MKLVGILILALAWQAYSQTVRIQNKSIVLQIQQQCPQCIVEGHQLVVEEAEKLDSISFTGLDVKNISVLKYFKNLSFLKMERCYINQKIQFPMHLKTLNLIQLKTTHFPQLPDSLETLVWKSGNPNLKVILPTGLKNLTHDNSMNLDKYPNNLIKLVIVDYFQKPVVAFPNSLRKLTISKTGLDSLPNLPPQLESFTIKDDYKLTKLPSLPTSLKLLSIFNTQIIAIPQLPEGLKVFHIEKGYVKTFPDFPKGLKELNLEYNSLTAMPDLPPLLEVLYCNNNQLKELPKLPATLKALDISFNKGIQIPELNTGLEGLGCSGIDALELPALPSSLAILLCDGNKLKHMPPMPQSLKFLSCARNNLDSSGHSAALLGISKDCETKLLNNADYLKSEIHHASQRILLKYYMVTYFYRRYIFEYDGAYLENKNFD